jgi:hypothetical protein
MDKTPKLNLNVPRGNDYVDIDVLGQNFEIIDEKLGENIERTNENLHQINTLSDRVTIVENELSDQQELTTTLKYGSQVIEVSRDTPFNVLSLKGRTLVNLLGKDGNCEDVTKFFAGSATLSKDPDNKVYGNNGLKIIATSDTGSPYAYIRLTNIIDKNKFYLFLAHVKNGNTNRGVQTQFRLWNGTLADKSSPYITDSTKFNIAYCKVSPNEMVGATDIDVRVISNQASTNQYFYSDGWRVYEIDQATYNKIDVDPEYTGDKLAEKFPYVDSVQPIQNPYLIRRNRNLIPPFTQWNLHANARMKSPYELELTASGIDQRSTVDIDVIPNTDYTISIEGNGAFALDMMTGFINLPEVYSFNSGNRTSIRLVFSNSSTGTFTFTNPMLNIGSTALPFEPYQEDYLFIETKLHSSINGTIYDELIPTDTGYEKLKKFKEVVLDGSLWWNFYLDYSGAKGIQVDLGVPAISAVSSSHSVVKNDGRILINKIQAVADSFWFDDGSGNKVFRIAISDTDSGWGETYTPTPQEIQAYFNGWKMNNGTFGTPYNGTGTKTWVPWSATSNTGAVTTVPTTSSTDITNKVFDYYKLVYQLATPVREPVRYEGAISLKEGRNIVELGSGVIVRERVSPALASNTRYYINNTDDLSLKSANLKYTNAYILNVLRNQNKDFAWGANFKNTNSGYRVSIANGDFDPTAVYEVTYLVLGKYLFTVNPIDLLGSYEPNLNKAVDSLINRQINAETKISVLEKGIQQVFQSGVDGKAKLETAIIAKNGTVSKQGQIATFDELDAGIRNIRTSNIKSIQKGTSAISVDSTYIDVGISSVDTGKTIVLLSFVGGANQASNLLVMGRLLNSQTVRFQRVSPNVGAIIVDWQVIEFENVKSLQTGILTSTSTAPLTTINPVVFSKSVLFFSYMLNDISTSINIALMKGRLSSSTVLYFERPTAQQVSIYWQVVEFD